jgi:hypothetical protein
MPGQVRAFPAACSDPPGFERTEFPKQFNAAVLAFLGEHLRVNGAR